MKMISLVENNSCRADCGAIHGLSLYIETGDRRILFDMGPNALFLENAEALGVEIAVVDLAFLSHGHYDHGGGLPLFCKRNKQAPILISPHAFGDFAAREGEAFKDIGLPHGLREKFGTRLLSVSGRYDESLYVLTDVQGTDYQTAASATLLERGADGYGSDRFLHEQSLILTEKGKCILFAGCAHRGIVNILRAAEAAMGCEMDYVVSGFHLTNPGLGIDEPEALIHAVGEALCARKQTKYITGHCTGKGPYVMLKDMLGDRLDTMPAGSVFDLY